MTTSTHIAPPEAEVLSYFERLSNWGRRGAEDERGCVAMGVCLVDACQFEELFQACTQRGR